MTVADMCSVFGVIIALAALAVDVIDRAGGKHTGGATNVLGLDHCNGRGPDKGDTMTMPGSDMYRPD